ncbi:MAG: DNA gyrase inhibitor YacG [Methylacidiphilales bacterium]|nr:DNA gyrase inhibitor YacG [Candidatus Methylacidiphilales bacterium]
MSKPDKPDSASAKRCPICGKPVELRWRPFCSKRCADVDLNRWFSGAYAIPVVEDNEKPPEEGGEAG